MASERFRLTGLPAAALAISLALLPACARPPLRAAPPPPLGGDEAPPPRGVTQIAFLPDPTVPPPELPPDEEIIPPSPTMIPAPVYPRAALEAGCGDGTIGLRIIVDEQGRVSSVSDSPVVGSSGGSCGRSFRLEAEEALSGWIFRPAEWRRLEPGEDMDGDALPDYRRVTALKRIPVYLDVRIDFEVVNGRGRVRLTI